MLHYIIPGTLENTRLNPANQTAAEAASPFRFSTWHEMTGPSSSYSSPYPLSQNPSSWAHCWGRQEGDRCILGTPFLEHWRKFWEFHIAGTSYKQKHLGYDRVRLCKAQQRGQINVKKVPWSALAENKIVFADFVDKCSEKTRYTSIALQHPLHQDWLQLPHACLLALCLKLMMQQQEVVYPQYHFLLSHGFQLDELWPPLQHLQTV